MLETNKGKVTPDMKTKVELSVLETIERVNKDVPRAEVIAECHHLLKVINAIYYVLPASIGPKRDTFCE